jgi:hypothetical protein
VIARIEDLYHRLTRGLRKAADGTDRRRLAAERDG